MKEPKLGASPPPVSRGIPGKFHEAKSVSRSVPLVVIVEKRPDFASLSMKPSDDPGPFLQFFLGVVVRVPLFDTVKADVNMVRRGAGDYGQAWSAHDAIRRPIGFEALEDFLLVPGEMAEFDNVPNPPGQSLKKSLQAFHVQMKRGGELEENRSQPFFQDSGAVEKNLQFFLDVQQFLVMGNLLRSLEQEPESFRNTVTPTGQSLGFGQVIVGIIDLYGGESLRIEGKPP